MSDLFWFNRIETVDRPVPFFDAQLFMFIQLVLGVLCGLSFV